MRRRLNAAAVAVAAAALLAASVLTAGPASATITSLTKASCQEQGGSYTVAKGLRTCTVGPFFTRYVDVYNVYGEGVYGAGSYVYPAYFGYWTEHRGWRDVTVTTQKGGNVATQTTPVTISTLVSRFISDELCGYDTGFTSSYATVLDCYIAGVYPPDIP
jgi:hypothetical protein